MLNVRRLSRPWKKERSRKPKKILGKRGSENEVRAKSAKLIGRWNRKSVARTQTYPPELLVTKNILTDGTDHVIVSVEVDVTLLVRHGT